jgi:hypothetical protein
MADTMCYMGLDIERDMLPSRETVMNILRTYGESYGALEHVTKEHVRQFGKDMIWRYPLCDGTHTGGIIVPVREGFLWLPYDEIDNEDYEQLLLDEARFMDASVCDFLIRELLTFTGGLYAALSDIRRLATAEYNEHADCDDQCRPPNRC